MTEEPLGRAESQTLEYKGRDSLQDPRAIAREVVGMLNSKKGGVVWVGVREDDGIAHAFEPLTDPAGDRVRLLDSLMSLIVPAIEPDEVHVEKHPVEAGCILRVDVGRVGDGRGPFAYQHKGMLGFVRRMDHRIVPMGYSEIFERREGNEEGRALKWIRSKRDDVLTAPPQQRLHIAIAVDPPVEASKNSLEVQYGAWWRQTIRGLSQGPNRLHQLSRPTHALEPKVLACLEASRETFSGASRVRARPEGTLEIDASLDAVTFSDPRAGAGEHKQVHPFFLLGSLATACGLAKDWFVELGVRVGHVHLDLALTGMRGIGLRAYSPRSYGWAVRDETAMRHFQEELFALGDPITLGLRPFLENPHAAAISLTERVYNEFGFERREMPREIDFERERIEVPD